MKFALLTSFPFLSFALTFAPRKSGCASGKKRKTSLFFSLHSACTNFVPRKKKQADMSPKKPFAAMLLACLPLVAAAQLPALTDSAEGQTLSTDTTWEAGDVVTVDTARPLPAAEPPVYRHIVRRYVVDTPLSDVDLHDLLHLPAWTDGAGLLAPWRFSLWSLSPIRPMPARPAWAVWVGALLLALVAAAAAALVALHRSLPPPLPHDDALRQLTDERRRSLTAAVLIATGGALFLHWPALVAGGLVGLYACHRYRTCRRKLTDIPPNPPSR